jgi:hypothetical protein
MLALVPLIGGVLTIWLPGRRRIHAAAVPTAL